MASGNQWEVVGKNKKKTPPSPVSKGQKKQQFVAKAPKVDTNAPVREDRTIYSAFLDKEQKKERSLAANGRQNPGNASANNNASGKKTVPQKKKKPDDNKKQEKVTADSAISEINHHELESILTKSQQLFPENQDVWLKDLASFLNHKLERVKGTDNTFKGKPTGYPLSQLSQSCQQVLHSVVKKFSNQTLDYLFYFCVQTMLTESAKDRSVIGFKIFLQLLAHHKPDIIMSKMHQYIELLKTYQNRPQLCLSILWAVGQCGNKNFKCGLKVWLDLMMPALEIRQAAHYPVEYLEHLISSHKKTNAYGIVTLREYFQVLDVVFSPGFNLSNELRKRLVALYPHIRELAYGDTPSHNLRTFFPSYLARYNVNANQAIKNELLECLVRCLTTDKQSFSVWCQLYTKHLVASGHLLEHINHEWSKLESKFDKKLLHETLRSFSVTNDEMETQGRANKEGLLHCSAATKELAAKLTRGGFPWGLLIFFLISVLASIVAYDVVSNPTFRESRTMRFLEHYGILAVLEQAWGRIYTFLTLAAEWLKTNCPVYYAYVKDTVGPFCVMVWSGIKDFAINTELVTRPHRAWIGAKAWNLYVWVYELSPETWAWCYDMSVLAWEVIKDYTLWLWKHFLHLAGEVEHYVTHHLFTGALSKESLHAMANRTMTQVQVYASSFWTWCNLNIVSLVK